MTSQARGFGFWVALLRDLLGRRQDSLAGTLDQSRNKMGGIFDAADVRERWLHAEVFLAARSAGVPFYVSWNLPGYGKPDLTAWESHDKEGALLMLGEVKLLGTRRYCSKDFSGTALGTFLDELEEKGQVLIEPSRLPNLNPGKGSLLKDYKRLVDFKGDPEVLRLLALVLDAREEDDNLGRLLRGVEFEHQGTTAFQSESILCKAWKVTGQTVPRIPPNSETGSTPADCP
jgi:hypothetical protein